MKSGAPPRPPARGSTPPAPPEGPSAAPFGPGAARSKIPYRRLVRVSTEVVGTAPWLFLGSALLALSVQTLAQYNFQLFATLTELLKGASGPTGGKGDWLQRLVPQDLETAAVLFAVLLLALVAGRLGDRLLGTLADNIMTVRLQRRLHDRLLQLGPGYHQQHDVGTTTLVVQQFVPGTQMLLKDIVAFPVVRLLGLLSGGALLLGNVQQLEAAPMWMNATLLSLLLLLPIGTWWFGSRVRTAFADVREHQQSVSEETLNSLSQPTEVQVLGAEPQRAESFAAATQRLLKSKVRASLRSVSASQFQSATPAILQALFVIYAVFFAMQSGQSAVQPIVAILLLVPTTVQPIQDVLQFIVGLNTAWPQVEKVIDILDEEPAVQDRPGAVDAPAGNLPVQVDRLTFRYVPGGRAILDDVSLDFEPGTVTALVARSGGGKSTVFHLLCRLQDPESGTIRLGGRDIRDLKLRSYRRRVARVSQFPLFIVDTFRANFRLADADATDDEIRRVCERTGLWEVLVRAAEGGDPLGTILPRQQGQGLSGGERRLFAITRALLTEPAVMLLDEPTTGIDAIGRQRLQGIVRDVAKDTAVVLVDHNVQEFVAVVSDRVCVLDGGKIVEIGTPEELIAKPGLFQQLYLHGEEASGGDDPGDGGAPPGAGGPPGMKGPPGGPPPGFKPGAGGPKGPAGGKKDAP